MSIRIKLTILLVAFTLVPVILFGTIVFQRIETVLTDVRMSQLNALADLKKGKITDYFSERRIDIRAAQANPGIAENLVVLSANQHDRRRQGYGRAAARLRDIILPFIEISEYLDVMLVDSQGALVYASNPAHTGRSSDLPNAFRAAFERAKKDIMYSDVVWSKEAGGRPVMFNIAPVRNSAGSFIGEIIFELDMRPVYAILGDRTGLGETGESLIARQEERELLFLSPLRYRENAEMRERISFGGSRARAIQVASRGENGAGITSDYRGEDVLAAWRYLPTLRWGLVTKIDAREAFASVRLIKIIFLVAGGIMVLLSIAVASLISRAVTRPLHRLQEGAEAIAAGDLTQRVGTDADDEFGKLGRVFDSMTDALNSDIAGRQQAEDALRRLNEDLERLVRERTSRLAEQSRKLDAFFRHTITPLVFLDREFNYSRVNEAYANACSRPVNFFEGRNYFLEYPSYELKLEFENVVRTKKPYMASARPFTYPYHPEWGATYWDLYLYPILNDAGDVDFLVFAQNDVTERTRNRQRNDVTTELLKLYSQTFSRTEYLDAALQMLKGWSRCRHGGIRVADRNGNIPYVSCSGFSADFLASERTLSLEHDRCACTRVVSSRPDPLDRRVMSPVGSFFTGDFEGFIESLSEEERERYRGGCIRSGFQSLAVIPIRHQDRVLGAIHLADEQEGLFTLSSVEFLEQLAIIIGEAILRFDMEEESARLVFAVESSAEAVVVTEPNNGMIQYVNRAFETMTGYSKQEAVGRSQHILDSGKHDEEYYRAMRDTLKRDGVWRGILVNRKKDGTLYYEDCAVSPVTNASGEILNYISLKRDVTEELRLESIAESVNTMDNIGYVFAGVRHEIGNPVNSVKMLLTVLQHKLKNTPGSQLYEYIDRMFAEIGRVEQLLKNLKGFNLYETPELTALEIAPFIAKFAGLLREDFAGKGIVITEHLAADAGTVLADPRALQQVLLNIVTNAADALEGRPDPAISLLVMRDTGRVVISVADNGCGMTEKQRSDLFKPFYTSKQSGTGLGMVIVKKMLTKMNGTIEVSSAPDRGTVVNISLPEDNHGAPQ